MVILRNAGDSAEARKVKTTWIEIDGERCKACGLCIDVCKHACLDWSTRMNRAGYTPVQNAAPERCAHCGLCLDACPEPLCIRLTERQAQSRVDSPRVSPPIQDAQTPQKANRSEHGASERAEGKTLRAFMKGNDAIVAGALAAGCRAFFGYPITPASEIAHGAMQLFGKVGALAIQAESEIAAVHMLYGAGASGTMAMTATSGPGLSLMQDGLSYMAAAQIPGVVVDIMRAGPGLGNIAPEQTDYAMIVRGGGHGEYRIPVLAPASVQEMFDMTREAFRLAFEYQTPVCILADAFIGQMMESIILPESLPSPESIASARFPFKGRADGTPQTSGNVVSTLELVPESLARKNDARFARYDAMKSIARFEYAEFGDAQDEQASPVGGSTSATEALPPAFRANEIDSPPIDTLVVAFGICARLSREAAQIAAKMTRRTFALIRPQTLWPIDADAWRPYVRRADKICVVECNRGMMRADLARFVDDKRLYGICRDGGVVPTVAEIVERLVS